MKKRSMSLKREGVLALKLGFFFGKREA